MATPIVNYVRARIAFMPIMATDDEAEPGGEDDYEFWLTLLPEGERVLQAVTERACTLVKDYRAATEALNKGWTTVPEVADAEALLPARNYQWSGRRISTNEPFPTGIITIKEL
jgi:hypothetical protein